MKKFLAIVAIAATFTACNEEKKEDATTVTKDTTTVVTPDTTMVVNKDTATVVTTTTTTTDTTKMAPAKMEDKKKP